MQGNDRRWKAKFITKWGYGICPDRTEDAAVIAGSWQNLFRSRRLLEKTAPENVCPCPEEIDALLHLAGRSLSSSRQSLLLFLVDTSSSVSNGTGLCIRPSS